jgi:hypothetical protein
MKSILLWTAAVVVPGASLLFALPLEGGSAVLPAPFGWPALLAAHLLAGLPLALLLGRLAPRGPVSTALLIAAGVLLASLTFLAGAAVGPILHQAGSGYSGRAVVRGLWCLLLQTPWCAAGWAFLTPRPVPRLTWLLAAGMLLVPLAYAVSLARDTSRQVEQLLDQGRPVRAIPLLDALCAVGLGRVDGETPERLRGRLLEQLQTMKSALPGVPVGERARLLAMLDRADESARLLAGQEDPSSQALLASIRQQQGRFDESNRLYHQALTRLGELPSSPVVRGNSRQIYDGLAFNAREQGRPQVAERLYLEALDQLPEEAAHFHFQLGRHYHLGGRPGEALHHLGESARLDTARYGEPVRRLTGELRQQTPGCLLPRR